IPDLADAVASVRLSTDPEAARRVLAAVRAVPTPVWGLRWNSNSMVAWVLARAELAHGLAPPVGGCAPGWEAGLAPAARVRRRALASFPACMRSERTGTRRPW